MGEKEEVVKKRKIEENERQKERGKQEEELLKNAEECQRSRLFQNCLNTPKTREEASPTSSNSNSNSNSTNTNTMGRTTRSRSSSRQCKSVYRSVNRENEQGQGQEENSGPRMSTRSS